MTQRQRLAHAANEAEAARWRATSAAYQGDATGAAIAWTDYRAARRELRAARRAQLDERIAR